MHSVDLSALRRVENLGFSYVTGDPISAVEAPGYFLAAKDHLRAGERIFVTSGLGQPAAGPSVRDYVVVSADRHGVTLLPLAETPAPSSGSRKRKG